MTEADVACFSYGHGGLAAGHDHVCSSGRGHDFAGLVRAAGDQGRWPRIPVVGEGGRHGFAGGEGMREAAATMRAAGGRPYVPQACELPREGLHAPAIFVEVNQGRTRQVEHAGGNHGGGPRQQQQRRSRP